MTRTANVFAAFSFAVLSFASGVTAQSETDTLMAGYKRLLNGIQEQHAKKNQELAQAYQNAIKISEQNFMRIGNLEGLLAAREEAKRFASEKTVPPTPAPNTNVEIAKFQIKYLDALKGNDVEKNKQILALAERFAEHLERTKRILTQQGKIQEAKAVNDLKAEVQKFPEVVAATMDIGTAEPPKTPPAGDTTPPPVASDRPVDKPAVPPPPTGPAAKYAGKWKRQSPKFVNPAGKTMQMPRIANCGAAYDSKRKLCVLYGSGSFDNKRNDMWVYDPAADKWTCLQQHDPNADGKTLPKGGFAGGGTSLGFCCDPEEDLYWYLDPESRGVWSYDPNAKAWKKTSFSTTDTKHANQFVGLGYHPGLRSLISACGPFNPKTGRVNPGVNPPGEVIYGWQPSSAAMSNGFSSPDEAGCFLAIGKNKQNVSITWLFDPAKGAWTVLKPTQSPPARCHANVVYHKNLRVWVMYGGYANEEKEAQCDTWVYAPHLTTWLQIDTDDRPPPCSSGALWYDEAGDQVIFFTAARNESETWALKLSAAE